MLWVLKVCLSSWVVILILFLVSVCCIVVEDMGFVMLLAWFISLMGIILKLVVWFMTRSRFMLLAWLWLKWKSLLIIIVWVVRLLISMLRTKFLVGSRDWVLSNDTSMVVFMFVVVSSSSFWLRLVISFGVDLGCIIVVGCWLKVIMVLW